jgi:3-oxoacyl-[acyl-carrier-protein] synthase-3
MYHSVISGIGSHLPERRLTNTDLEQMVETSDEWIVTRTGISERRIAAPHEATSDLAYHAAAEALRDAGLQAADLDLLIVATSTPDHQLPPVACQLQARLGCRTITAFDVSATCMGFISALEIADQFIRTGKSTHALVVGADTMSRVTDYTDRGTCILFGDGAGAFVLSRSTDTDRKGIISTRTHSDGEHFFDLYIPCGGSRQPEADEPGRGTKIVMDGRKIFKLAVTAMSRTITETLEATGISRDEVDWLIPHQANQRIIEAVANQVDFPMERVISVIKQTGNNSAATIPVAFHTAVQEGRVRRGDTILLVAFGGGLLWGSILLKY